jgi:hypothetical protein
VSISLSNWIYVTPAESAWKPTAQDDRSPQQELIARVRAAVEQLRGNERMVLERHRFDAVPFTVIAAELNWRVIRVQNVERRALRRLRRLLAPYVRERFGIEAPQAKCPICDSACRGQADIMIAARINQESFGVLMSRLRCSYGIRVISPQTIIGHSKYHL